MQEVIASNSTAPGAFLSGRNFADLSLRAVFAKQSHRCANTEFASAEFASQAKFLSSVLRACPEFIEGKQSHSMQTGEIASSQRTLLAAIVRYGLDRHKE